SEPLGAERVVISNPCAFIDGQGLLQAGDAFANASRPRVHVPQSRHGDRSVTRDVPLATLSDRPFEQTGGLAQFPPHALQIREIETSDDDAERLIERFGDPDRLVSVSVSFVEHTALGEDARQDSPEEY